MMQNIAGGLYWLIEQSGDVDRYPGRHRWV